MAVVKKISELVPKGSALSNTDLLVVGVDNGTDYDLKSVTGAQILGNVISQTITDGDTTHSPSSNVVFDSLDLKVDKVVGKGLSTEDYTTSEKSKLAGLSGTNTGDQTLQQVTDKGSSTTNAISVTTTGSNGFLGANTIISQNSFGRYTTIDSDGKVTINSNGVNTSQLRASNVTADVILEFPNKTVGTYTIATTTDLTSKVDSNTAITGATKTKITYDAKGLVTSGLDATTADISDSTDKRYVTDAEKTNINYLNTVASNVQDQINAKVNLNIPLITPATKTKITYDAKGLVTSGADATTADIADSLNKRYVTDANLTVIGNTSGTNTGDQTISDATISLTDITTNNFSTTKHGFVPKGTNVGNYLKDDGTWGAISAGGLTYFTEAQSTASPNATVNVDSLTAIASTTNADFAIVSKGTGALTRQIPDGTATRGNKRGENAVDLQTSRGSATQVASGENSFTANRYNTASGIDATALGNSNIASGNFGALALGNANNASGPISSAIGYQNTASGTYSTSLGNANTSSATQSFSCNSNNIASASNSFVSGTYSTASGENSTVMGYYCQSFGVKGRWVTGFSGFGILGDGQKSIFTISKRTTDTTTTVLVADNATPSATNQLTLQNNNSIRFKGTIIGRQSGSTNTSAWDIDGIIQRGTSAATTTLLIGNVNVVQNTPAWGTPTLTANTTLGCLTVSVIGALTTNIQWTCVIDTTEVIYA